MKIGNSYGVILPKGILGIVGIDPKKGCLLSVEENRITLKPRRRRKRKDLDQEVAEAMVRFMKRYRSDLTKLAHDS